MKIAKVIHAEPEYRPDGSKAYICILQMANELAGNELSSDKVIGLKAGDIISPPSVLITPTKKYIAWDDNKFGPVDEAYADVPSWVSYVVTYMNDGNLYHEALVSTTSGEHTVISAPPAPEGMTFNFWALVVDGEVSESDLYQPGDEITVEGDTVLSAVWGEEPDEMIRPGGGLNPGGGLVHGAGDATTQA